MKTDSIAVYFQDDHTRLEAIYHEFQAVKHTDAARATACFAEFKAGLERHIVWEEEMLFPGFESRTGMRDAGPTAVMRMEHTRIKNYLRDIAQKLARHDVATDAEEAGLQQTLADHNWKEEQILYPAIDDMLPPAERSGVFARMGVALEVAR
jgi:iron-sulfur cluster repair protein YtfE (RIC family)